MKQIQCLPPTLRGEVLFRLSGSVLFTILGIVCMAARMGIFLIFSGFLPAMLCMGSALGFLFSCRNCLAVEGVCLEIRHGLFKRRVKAILLETKDGPLLVKLRTLRLQAAPGSVVRVYVKPDALIYEQDGTMVLLEPLAVEDTLHSAKKETVPRA